MTKTHLLFSLIFLSIALGVGVVFTISQYAPPFVYASELSDAQSDEAALKKRLAELEAEIAKQQAALDGQKGQSASISGEINKLKGEINKTKLDIERKNTLIRQLSNQINEKTTYIQDLNQELGREKASLSQLLRKMHELESVSIFEIVLSKRSLSDYFIDRDNFNSIQSGLQESFQTIVTVQQQTNEQKKLLEEQKNKEADVKAALEEDKKKVEVKESTQKQLLAVSKATEQTYEQVIKERQAQAAQIRARLFELAGGVQGGGIPFGDAVTYANAASEATGVRTAFILGILKQESNLGKNVGTCNRVGDARTYRDIMPGPVHYANFVANGNSCTGAKSPCSWRDDQSVFLSIVKELNINPEGQPLSCPIGGSGWGGAMGPSQFIPSTWMSVRAEVQRLTGASLANPWNPRHAVMATAVYLRDLGANKGGYTAEREAACRYYSGRGCSDPAVRNAFYGDGVLAHASALQQDIDFLKDN